MDRFSALAGIFLSCTSAGSLVCGEKCGVVSAILRFREVKRFGRVEIERGEIFPCRWDGEQQLLCTDQRRRSLISRNDQLNPSWSSLCSDDGRVEEDIAA